MKVLLPLIIASSISGCSSNHKNNEQQSSNLTSIVFQYDATLPFKDVSVTIKSVNENSIQEGGEFREMTRLHLGQGKKNAYLKIGSEVYLHMEAIYDNNDVSEVSSRNCQNFEGKYIVKKTDNRFALPLCLEDGTRINDEVVNGVDIIPGLPQVDLEEVANATFEVDMSNDRSCFGDKEVCPNSCVANSMFCSIDFKTDGVKVSEDGTVSYTTNLRNSNHSPMYCDVEVNLYSRIDENQPFSHHQNRIKDLYVSTEINTISSGSFLTLLNMGLPHDKYEIYAEVVGVCK